MARFHTHQQRIAVFGDNPLEDRRAVDRSRQAGEQFGTKMHVVLGHVVDDIKVLLGWIGDIKKGLDGIANSDVFKWLNQPIGLPGTRGRTNCLAEE